MEPYSDEQNAELEAAQEWLWGLDENDERLVVLRLLNTAYKALDARVVLGSDPLADTGPVRDALGDYLYPDDGERPVIRLWRQAQR